MPRYRIEISPAEEEGERSVIFISAPTPEKALSEASVKPRLVYPISKKTCWHCGGNGVHCCEFGAVR